MKTCPQCQQPMRDDAPEGLCPACLLREAAGGVASGSEATVLLGASPGLNPRAGKTLRYFGNYELIEEVGVGGMGVVWKARQASLNRTIALKMIRGGMLADSEEVKRFRAEAQAAANLQHPNIVAIHEIGEHEGQHYYSMDFIQGRSLHELCDGTPVEPERAAQLLAIVAGAVEFAHRAQILHRDLKPHNVMMDAEGVPHLTDFGLAKRMDMDSGMTQTGAIMGSPSYMAPEQAQGKNDAVGPRTDVYSLGAILYQTLTGRPPFQAATALDTVRQVVDAEPAPPRSVNPSVPVDLEAICLKCLEKDPARRYASAQEFADEVGRFLRHEPIVARPIGIIGRTAKWARRKPAIAALVLGNAATIAAIVVGQFVANVKLQKSYDALDEAAEAAKDQLAWSQLRQATVIRTSDQPGRRAQALSLLKSAAELEARPRSAHTPSKHELPSRAELRSEAVAALLTQDARLVHEMRVSALPEAASLARDGRRALGAWMQVLDAEKLMKGDTKGMRGGIAVQDISENREVLRVEKGAALEIDFTLSPDGGTIATAVAESKERKVTGYRIDLRDVASNTVKRALAWPPMDTSKTTTNARPRVFFSQDGTLLGAARNATNSEIVVWNLTTGEGRVIDYVKTMPHWIAFTPDSRHILLKTDPQKIERRALDGDARFEIALPQPAIDTAVMDVSGSLFLIATGIKGKPGGALLGMDWNTGAQQFSIPLAHAPRGVAAFGPDMRVVFCDGPDLAIYDIATGRVTLRMPRAGGPQPLLGIAWSADAKFITAVTQDGTARRWELSLDPPLASWRAPHDLRGTLAFSADGKWLAWHDGADVVLQSRSRDRSQRGETRRLPLKPSNGKLTGDIVVKLAFKSESTQVAAAFGREAALWDTATGKELLRRPAPAYAYVNDLAFDREGHLIVCHASSDGSSIQDATTDTVLWQSNTQRQPSDARLSKDARHAIVIVETSALFRADKTPPRLIEVRQGKMIAELKHPGHFIPDYTEFSADGGEVFLICSNALTAIQSDASLTEVGPNALKVSASADPASAVRWSLDQPDRSSTTSAVARTIFSHDGKWIVSATIGGFRVNDRATGSELFRVTLSDSLTTRLTLSPDDALLVIGDGKTTLQTLNLASLRGDLGRLGLDW